ncbi:MAG: yrrB 4 [Planctomycetaceae bacterium]|nr:yrrB 4 [Planctomycetaceae bacterium]
MSTTFSMPARQSWIISPTYDALFLIGSAFWVGGAFLIAQALGCAHGLAIFVLYVMATGHHLPGFLRIYTDPELFRQYRWRFLFFPPFIVGLAIVLAAFDLHVLTIVTFIWGLWHGMMQVYGFARIYDAKQGEISPLTARLDWSLCVSWFLLLSFGSTFFADDFRTRTADAGTSYIAELLLSPVLLGMLISAAVTISLVHIAYSLWAWWCGRRISILKFLLLGSSIGLFCVSYRLLAHDKLVGLATWEAFHDIQYYAIVWAYNRRSSERRQLSAVGRMMFQSRPLHVVLYLALIALYGGLDFGSRTFLDSATGETLRPVLVASAFLHFYFDGFIWKIRRVNVRRDLNIEAHPAVSVPPHGIKKDTNEAHVQLGFGDLLKQVALISFPIVVLLGLEVDRATWERPASEFAVTLFPNSTETHRNLARLYERDRVWDYAVREYQRAVELDPKSWRAQFGLGVALVQVGQLPSARQCFLAALEADSASVDVDFNLAMLDWQTQQYKESLRLLRSADAKFPGNPRVLTTLATFLTTCPERNLRDPRAALEFGERALMFADQSHQPEVLDAIAAAYALQGEFKSATAAIEKGITIAQKQHNARRVQALTRMLSLYQNALKQ